jgi:hypothetical protein
MITENKTVEYTFKCDRCGKIEIFKEGAKPNIHDVRFLGYARNHAKYAEVCDECHKVFLDIVDGYLDEVNSLEVDPVPLACIFNNNETGYIPVDVHTSIMEQALEKASVAIVEGIINIIDARIDMLSQYLPDNPYIHNHHSAFEKMKELEDIKYSIKQEYLNGGVTVDVT